ncbi:glutamic acid-rich protein isoform X2 [Nematostella vectensis]|uniref:glutamic acid-rich protein isoform X2 n=1 Tax=Nematostella vectensis TaxID=45351 RepID=UPI002076F353|nr:glutamic acid-rich protein isoform X2 [Nematostella vectensis]
MAGFDRLGGIGGSFYPGANSLQQPSIRGRDDRGRRDDRREDRFGASMRRDFGGFSRGPARSISPRRRRYSPEPSYSSAGSNRLPDRRGDTSYGTDRFASSTSRDDFGSGRGLSAQLQQQQQQLMAMVQTQSLLAAFQAQAKQAGLIPPLGGVGRPINQLSPMVRDRKRHMSPPRNGPVRKYNNNPGNRNTPGFNRNYQNRGRQQARHSNWSPRDRNNRDNRRDDRGKNRSRKDEDELEEEPYVEDDPDADDEKEKEKEKLEREKSSNAKEKKADPENDDDVSKEEVKKSINLANQNVDMLVKTLFDKGRQKYVCKVCKIMCNKEHAFRMHLHGKKHVKTWLESQGKSFESEMFKKAALKEKATAEASETSTKSKETDSSEKMETSKEEAEQQKTAIDDASAGDEEKTEVKKDDATVEIQKERTEEEESSSKEEKKQESFSKEEKRQESSSKEEKKQEKDDKKDDKEGRKASKSPAPRSDSRKEKEKPAPLKSELDIRYSCETRKSAVKMGDVVSISSITQAQVSIAGFANGENTQGCEFVKAVSGFNCRLCKTFIMNGADVMKHVKARKHQKNYRQYVIDHPSYEANQIKRNKELSDMLGQSEGQEMLLYEVEDEEKRAPHRYYSSDRPQVQITKYMVETSDQATQGGDHAEDHAHEGAPTHDDQEEQGDQNAKEQSDKTEDDDDKPKSDDQDAQSETSDVILENDDKPKEDNKQTPVETTETEQSDMDTSESYDPIAPTDDPGPVTPLARRGRRGRGRGGSASRGKGAGRGRGKGRGSKGVKQSPKAPTVKQEVLDTSNNDDGFMDGYEVIDEIVDDE